jgi:hypothetical protein
MSDKELWASAPLRRLSFVTWTNLRRGYTNVVSLMRKSRTTYSALGRHE